MPRPDFSGPGQKAKGFSQLPVEIELFVEPDGSVVFADLAADAVPIANRLIGAGETMFESLVCALRNWLAVLSLRWQVDSLKLGTYDHLADNLRGLREALRTLERTIDSLNQQLDERGAQIVKLQQEYKTLQNQREESPRRSARRARLQVFSRLRSIATQLPTLRAAAEEGTEVSAKDVLDMLTSLDQALSDMRFTPIGEVGEFMEFDPIHHRAVGKGARSVAPGDLVKVRFIGYLYSDKEVACKAEVTRVSDEQGRN